MAVNVSSLQLAQPGFVRALTRVVDGVGLGRDRLAVEVTESVLLRGSSPATTALRQLNDLGVHLTIDDLGTGYSSLTAAAVPGLVASRRVVAGTA